MNNFIWQLWLSRFGKWWLMAGGQGGWQGDLSSPWTLLYSLCFSQCGDQAPGRNGGHFQDVRMQTWERERGMQGLCVLPLLTLRGLSAKSVCSSGKQGVKVWGEWNFPRGRSDLFSPQEWTQDSTCSLSYCLELFSLQSPAAGGFNVTFF